MMKVIDLFCGIGGLSLGFEQAGFEIISAIDMWKDAIDTYNHNRVHKVGKVETVEFFNENELPKIISSQQVTGIIGGPPCQGFSTVGKRDIKDPRNKLYMEFYKAVKMANPVFFVIENVKGMLTLNKGAFVEDLITLFGPKGLGYKLSHKLLNAADYGIPQNRYRVFYVGIKDSLFEFPEGVNYRLTAKEGISDLEGSTNGVYATDPQNEYQKLLRGNCCRITNQEYTNHTEQTKSIVSMIPDGGNIRNLPHEYWNVRRYNKAFERMGTYKPSNTIDTGHRNYFHYAESRIPTVRECARIQSFPDCFEIVGPRGSQYKQVGNAVPPMLARLIAEKIKEIIA